MLHISNTEVALRKSTLRLGVAICALSISFQSMATPYHFQHVPPDNFHFIDVKGGSVSRPAAPAYRPPAVSAPSVSRPVISPSPNGASVSRPPALPTVNAPTGAPTAAVNGAGVSRPPPVGQTPAATTQAPTGVQRPGSVSRPAIQAGVASPPPKAAAPSAVDRQMTMGHSQGSLDKFRADQAKFSAPPVGIPTTRTAARSDPMMQQYGNRWGSADQYYAARSSSISRLPPATQSFWNSPPVYVGRARPAYGSYSGVFLGSLLGVGAAVVAIEASSAMWAYSHRTDPNYMAWRQDMMIHAPDRIAMLDREVSVLESRGVTPEPNALPEGVDPSLVVASETVLLATSEEAVTETNTNTNANRNAVDSVETDH